MVTFAFRAMQSALGITYGLISSVFFAIYVSFAEALRAQLPFACLMTITFSIGALAAGISTYFLEHTTWAPYSGPHSVWAFAQSREVFFAMVALVTSYMLGLAGLTACVKNLPPIVVAVAITLEPAVSVALAVLSGEESVAASLLRRVLR